MSRSEPRRRASTAVQLVFGVLLAGIGLFLVPTLALNGAVLAAAAIAVAWLGGIAAAWYLYGRDMVRDRSLAARERTALDLYRTLIERGGEAHVVIDPAGAVSFASPNLQAVLGVDPDRIRENGGLIDLVHGRDRRRLLAAFARVRSEPGSAASLEVSARRPDGGECHVAIRAVNLADTATVGGILFTLRDITPRKTFETEIQHLAYYDALTGLANRRFFTEQGARALAGARRNRDVLAVLYVDLDRFKQVNDLLGHETGDEVLRRVADALERTLRESDIVARMGGDEFAVILTDVRDAEAVHRVAHRLLENMPATAMDTGHEIPVGASIGVALFPEDGDTLESLLKAADLAMYRAKGSDSGVHFYRPELRRTVAEQFRIEEDMRRAMEHHEFRLHYQPIFNLVTGEMVGAEALSRWRHYTRGVMAASEFIRQAERAGLIRSLDRWAIARAVHQRTHPLGEVWSGWVAVNLSPQSLRDPELPAYIRSTLEAARLEPGALVLELPEAVVLNVPELATDLMWELKNTGAAIALDDYGAGAASFARLRELPIDILKLHPDYTAGIGEGEGDEHLVEATISIAHGIRAKVLAKGVERDDQIDWLRESGCDFVQGYLVGPPVSAADLAGELAKAERRPAST